MKIRKLIKKLQEMEKTLGNVEVVCNRETVENYIQEITHPSVVAIDSTNIEIVDGDGFLTGKNITVCVLES
jgi:hypothetical protein